MQILFIKSAQACFKQTLCHAQLRSAKLCFAASRRLHGKILPATRELAAGPARHCRSDPPHFFHHSSLLSLTIPPENELSADSTLLKFTFTSGPPPFAAASRPA
jgi:hypothetical protein